MEKFIVFFTILLALIFCSVLAAEEGFEEEPLQIEIKSKTLNYFEALKAGDVVEVKKYLSPSVYNKNRALFEQNKAYPDFLRNFYDNAEFFIENITFSDNTFTVNVSIEYLTGEKKTTEIFFQKEREQLNSNAFAESWRIIDLGSR